MADDWHVRWLKEGVEHWNRRRKKVTFRPDLSGVRFFDLLPADFRDSPKTSRFFEKIDLTEADLQGADLSGLNFSRGKFDFANLSQCDMSLTNFNGASFANANLTGARATNATFVGAKFDRSVLESVNFGGANARQAIFIQSDISPHQLTELAHSSPNVFVRLQDYLDYKSSRDSGGERAVTDGVIEQLEKDAPKPKKRYDVLFGTNRMPNFERGVVTGFGSSFGEQISFGVCEVIVPDGHRVGSLGSPLWRRVLNRKDDRLRLDSLISLNSDLFGEYIRQSIARMAVKERSTIFVHGYCTSFVDAVLRAAQIGHDLGIGQGVGLFSWPSEGKKTSYLADEAAAESSKYALADFIENFVQMSAQDSINIIAHSMGCRCVLNALEVLGSGRKHILGKLNQVILAAADVDSRIMPSLGVNALAHSKRTTSYVCGDDLALKVSGWLHGFPRVGFRPPTFVLEGMDTIVVNDKDLGDFSHGYLGTSRAVLNDVFALLKDNAHPGDRFSLEFVPEVGFPHWRIRD